MEIFKKRTILLIPMRKKVTLSFDDRVYKQFQKYCDEHAMILSGKLEIFMKDFLEHEKEAAR